MALLCPPCRTRLTPAEVVAAAVDAPWPEEQIVGLRCPACRAPLHARLRDGLAEIVTRSRAGVLQVHAAASEPELAAVGAPGAVEVWLRGEHRTIGRRTRWAPPDRASKRAGSR